MLLTPAEVAERLRVAPRTLETWRRRRQGPPSIKVNGVIRYDAVALERWVAERTSTVASA